MGCNGSKSTDVQEPKPVEGGEAAGKPEVEQNGTTPAAPAESTEQTPAGDAPAEASPDAAAAPEAEQPAQEETPAADAAPAEAPPADAEPEAAAAE